MKGSKFLVTLITLAFAQAVFAQEVQETVQQELQQAAPEPQQVVQQGFQQAMQQESQESGTPNTNIITIDFGPTIIGFAIGSLPTGDEVDLSAFGFGAQYERQIFDQLSVAGRFAYLGSDIEYEKKDKDSKFKMDLSSFSLEAHPRVYPFGGSFFLDGMVGYANVSLDLKGEVGTDKGPRDSKISISRSYSKYGAKLGWRADFGEPGGFIFEHSYGYYSAAGFGDTMGKQASKEISKKTGEDITVDKDIDDAFALFEDWLFVGGVRVTIAFGWRF